MTNTQQRSSFYFSHHVEQGLLRRRTATILPPSRAPTTRRILSPAAPAVISRTRVRSARTRIWWPTWLPTPATAPNRLRPTTRPELWGWRGHWVSCLSCGSMPLLLCGRGALRLSILGFCQTFMPVDARRLSLYCVSQKTFSALYMNEHSLLPPTK